MDGIGAVYTVCLVASQTWKFTVEINGAPKAFADAVSEVNHHATSIQESLNSLYLLSGMDPINVKALGIKVTEAKSHFDSLRKSSESRKVREFLDKIPLGRPHTANNNKIHSPGNARHDAAALEDLLYNVVPGQGQHPLSPPDSINGDEFDDAPKFQEHSLPKAFEQSAWTLRNRAWWTVTGKEAFRGVSKSLELIARGLNTAVQPHLNNMAKTSQILRAIRTNSSDYDPNEAAERVYQWLVRGRESTAGYAAAWDQVQGGVWEFSTQQKSKVLWCQGPYRVTNSKIAGLVCASIHSGLSEFVNENHPRKYPDIVINIESSVLGNAPEQTFLRHIAVQLVAWNQVKWLSNKTLIAVPGDGSHVDLTNALYKAVITDYMNKFSVLIVVDGVELKSELYRHLVHLLETMPKLKVIIFSQYDLPRELVKYKPHEETIMTTRAMITSAYRALARINGHLAPWETIFVDLMDSTGIASSDVFLDMVLKSISNLQTSSDVDAYLSKFRDISTTVLETQLAEWWKRPAGAFLVVAVTIIALVGDITLESLSSLSAGLQKCLKSDSESSISADEIARTLDNLVKREGQTLTLETPEFATIILMFAHKQRPDFATVAFDTMVNKFNHLSDGVRIINGIIARYPNIRSHVIQELKRNPALHIKLMEVNGGVSLELDG